MGHFNQHTHDMEPTIVTRAKEILERREKSRQEAEQKKQQQLRDEEQKYLNVFNNEFAEQLPLLEEAGIRVEARREANNDVYITLVRELSFEEGNNREADMEVSLTGGYRFEHPRREGHARSVFGHWPKENFYVFVYENLFKEVIA